MRGNWPGDLKVVLHLLDHLLFFDGTAPRPLGRDIGGQVRYARLFTVCLYCDKPFVGRGLRDELRQRVEAADIILPFLLRTPGASFL